MNGFNIVLVFAIILCARLGIRLISKWKELNNNSPDQEDSDQEKESSDKTD